MRKILKLLMLLLVVIGLSACKDKNPVVNNPKDYYKMLVNTQDEYEDSKSVNVLMTIVNGDVTTTSELIYNFDGTQIVNLAQKLTDGNTTYAAYVKDGLAYVNVNGNKSKGTLFDMEAQDVIENYSFNAMTAVIFNTFDKSLMQALVVSEDKDGEAKLTWDPTKYVFVSDGIDENDLDKAMERYSSIQSNITKIDVTIKYADNKVTKLTSTWVDKDNKTSNINIEFRGTGTQTIEYPSDLNTYQNR